MKADFSLESHKSKLSHSLSDILFDEKNDELSYFVLFMDSLNTSNYVKFLLDLNNFEQTCNKKKCCDSDSQSACDCSLNFSKSMP